MPLRRAFLAGGFKAVLIYLGPSVSDIILKKCPYYYNVQATLGERPLAQPANVAESTNPPLDNDLTRFQLRRNSWMQAQQPRANEALPNHVADNELPEVISDDPLPSQPSQVRSPDWPSDIFDPSLEAFEDDLHPSGRLSPGLGSAHLPAPDPRHATPSPLVDNSQTKTTMKRKMSDHSQASHKSSSERSDPLTRNPIADLISSSLPTRQERAQLLTLNQKSAERQTLMTKHVVDSMSGMNRLTDLLAVKLAPPPSSSAIDQDSAQTEHDMRLKEQALSLEERMISLAERQATFDSQCANEAQDTVLKRASEYASIVARFISSGLSPQVAKDLADDTLKKFSQGHYLSLTL